MRASSVGAWLLLLTLVVQGQERGDPGIGDGCLTGWETRQRLRPGRPAPAPLDCTHARESLLELSEFTAVPDRWRIVDTLGYPERRLDPYAGNNVLKGDRPAIREDWFVSLNVISDSTFEPRRIPTPVGVATTNDASALDVVGNGEQLLFNENLIFETVLYKGDTVFRPPDLEFRFIPVLNFSRVSVEERGVLKADPRSGTSRSEGFVGIQGLFFDKHLRNVSARYDFDSLRIGIQPITADFRGFLFQDSPFGVRLFGTRRNNLFQYNLGWFRRIEKDTNSGLNDITEQDPGDALRKDDVFLFNVYRQDYPWLGFTSQAVLVHNRNREGGTVYYDDNGFIARPASIGNEIPRDYDVTYLGVNGDGHIGRWNLSVSSYFAFGDETPAAFTTRSAIRAYFGAVEASRDFDWLRLKATFVYASGDEDPFDGEANGFDAIFENPLIAGADTSLWIRQPLPLIGGGRVSLSGRNGILNSMRSSKELGQSNFTNPGIILLGVGADLDLTPRLRVSAHLSQLWFEDSRPVEVARNQGWIDSNIGQDISVALTYRPLISQNIVFRLSAATLIPGKGYEALLGTETPYSVLANLVLSY